MEQKCSINNDIIGKCYVKICGNIYKQIPFNNANVIKLENVFLSVQLRMVLVVNFLVVFGIIFF